jgi:hypothetical protein
VLSAEAPVPTRAAIEVIAAWASSEKVVAGVPVELVVLGPALQEIVTGIAIDLVRSTAGTDPILSAGTVDVVTPTTGHDHVRARRAVDDVPPRIANVGGLTTEARGPPRAGHVRAQKDRRGASRTSGRIILIRRVTIGSFRSTASKPARWG